MPVSARRLVGRAASRSGPGASIKLKLVLGTRPWLWARLLVRTQHAQGQRSIMQLARICLLAKQVVFRKIATSRNGPTGVMQLAMASASGIVQWRSPLTVVAGPALEQSSLRKLARSLVVTAKRPVCSNSGPTGGLVLPAKANVRGGARCRSQRGSWAWPASATLTKRSLVNMMMRKRRPTATSTAGALGPFARTAVAAGSKSGRGRFLSVRRAAARRAMGSFASPNLAVRILVVAMKRICLASSGAGPIGKVAILPRVVGRPSARDP
mmetsp:Transcript_49614/g.106238  ORF Transcript_49614/g.106238 Transcript_49614/m.106238 type:complete len:268 (-) Transcript_49614:1854-2657(-)